MPREYTGGRHGAGAKGGGGRAALARLWKGFHNRCYIQTSVRQPGHCLRDLVDDARRFRQIMKHTGRPPKAGGRDRAGTEQSEIWFDTIAPREGLERLATLMGSGVNQA